MKNLNKLILCCCLFACCVGSSLRAQETLKTDAESMRALTGRSLSDAMVESGDNRKNLKSAIKQIEPEYREGMLFLVMNMPKQDLETLDANFLLAHVRGAYQAKAESPWGAKIPEEIFFNDVLAYCNVDESRENWRAKLRQIALPIVEGCKTPAEAAQRLNEQLFKKVGVKYSTRRKRANQSPSESMEQGLASCTGLSILLTDACRSVCVPARLAGIPSWPNKRGNHTWVEVWDQKWYFTGAAEPDKRGLNHAWFQGDAGLAKKDSRLHAIYAISFARTGVVFPAVWSRGQIPIFAVNVTDRYTPAKKAGEAKGVAVMVRVWDTAREKRLPVDVVLHLGDGKQKSGVSRNNEADMNDMLTFRVMPNKQYKLELKRNGQTIVKQIEATAEKNQVFDLKFGDE